MEPSEQRRPTLRDVAALAGVSFKTVSRVVNGETGVSAELTTRVNDAVRELGYRPDDRARRLRQGDAAAGAIGFIIPDVANPFFSAILRSIEDVADARDSLVFSGSNDGREEREEQLIEAFVTRRVDGFVAVPAGRGVGPLRAELDRGTPIVFLDLQPNDADVDIVRSDHRGGARLAAEHLLAGGHRDIAFVGDDPRLYSAEQRLAGFLDATGDTGSDVPAHRILQSARTPEEWRATIREYLAEPDPPTALFTAQNLITVSAVHAIHDLRLQHEIAQIGFDDVEFAEIVEPGISVVAQDPAELGRRAAHLLFRRIDGDRGEVSNDVLELHIVARGSGEIGPTR